MQRQMRHDNLHTSAPYCNVNSSRNNNILFGGVGRWEDKPKMHLCYIPWGLQNENGIIVIESSVHICHTEDASPRHRDRMRDSRLQAVIVPQIRNQRLRSSPSGCAVRCYLQVQLSLGFTILSSQCCSPGTGIQCHINMGGEDSHVPPQPQTTPRDTSVPELPKGCLRSF